MSFRLCSFSRVFSLIALLLFCVLADTARPGARLCAFALHEVRISHPHALRREAVHGRLRSEGSIAAVSAFAPPHAYSVRPMVRINTRPTSVQPCLRPARIHFRLSRRAWAVDVRGEFQHVRPHIADKKGPQDVDETSDTWDTIDWLTKHVSNHNGRVGMYGISYPGFYASCGMIDAHPALESRIAAGAGRRLVRGRRLASQRRVFPGPCFRLDVVERSPAR